MANEQQSPSTSAEVPLEDIDKLLDAEDPGFSEQLEAVRVVEADKDLVIEASVIDEALGIEDKEIDKNSEKGIKKYLSRFRAWRASLRARLRARLIQLFWQSVQFLKTRPIEFFFYSLATGKYLAKRATIPFVLFSKASGLQKAMALLLIAIAVGVFWIIGANLKGIWLPQLNKPLLTSFEPIADWVETFESKDKRESFYAAFPQELHMFLFKKFKVNLKPAVDSPNPMGAFELIAEVDSKDTAVEVGDRQVEFHDLLQRVFEQESANDLSTDLGKSRVKNRVKKELDAKLTQGWVKDIQFKTFILKP